MNGIVEILAAVCGIAGTLALALKGRHAGWGFVCYLGSNIAWISFAYANGHRWLLAQHAVFTVTSLLGIYVWLLRPQVRIFMKHYRVARRYTTRRRALQLAWTFTGLLP